MPLEPYQHAYAPGEPYLEGIHRTMHRWHNGEGDRARYASEMVTGRERRRGPQQNTFHSKESRWGPAPKITFFRGDGSRSRPPPAQGGRSREKSFLNTVTDAFKTLDARPRALSEAIFSGKGPGENRPKHLHRHGGVRKVPSASKNDVWGTFK